MSRARWLILPILWMTVIASPPAGAAPAYRSGSAHGEAVEDAPGWGFRVQRNIVYRIVATRRLRLDLYVPDGADGTNPLALYIHGGGWVRGSRRMGQVICRPLAERGYVTASIDYRLAGDAGWPAQIEDCQAAVRWLEEHAAEYGGDASKFVVTGGSAGGQLALSLACGWGEAWDNPMDACCSWYGPSDLAALGTAPKVSRNLQEYLGATRAGRERNARQASALLHVDPLDPPVLFIHGVKDPLVPIEQSRSMHRALKDAGVTTELIEVPEGNHGALLAPPAELAQLVARMIDFFDAQLAR